MAVVRLRVRARASVRRSAVHAHRSSARAAGGTDQACRSLPAICPNQRRKAERRTLIRAATASWWLCVAGLAAGQTLSFGERLEAMTAVANRHLAASADGAERYPASLRRVAWMHFDGDARPDALLVLKQTRDDCAAASRGQRACKALLLTGTADGGFTVATEFPLGEQPLVFRKNAQGRVDSLYYTADNGSDPAYKRYAVSDGAFKGDGTALRMAQLAEQRVFVTDDRSLPLVIDQTYAATQFENRRARLAPFRLHVDSINTRPTNSLVADASFPERAKFLAEALAPDAARIVAAAEWHQTLDLRIWSCDDWMVPRRFWEVEELRLGRVGVCAEPAVFALRRGIVQSTAEYVALARYRLLHEIGVAWVLRSAPITGSRRESLKAPSQRESLMLHGTVAGLLIGNMLKLQPLDSAPQLLSLWRRVSDQWFTVYERDGRSYVIKSPELRAYDHDLAESERAMLCTLKALGSNAPGVRQAACSAQTLETIAQMRGWLQDSLVP